MSDLLIARCQMGMSLAFHIIFAVAGVAMPLMMLVAELLWIRTGQEVYLTLAKRWAKGTAILFAIGAVSGTVLSFELGLLWPKFMGFAGSIIGMPFSLEGFAFFTEAIFLGIYFYGWGRVSRAMHVFAGAVVAVSGALSALFVVLANGWMNTPTGFKLVGGHPADIDPIAAMFNPAGMHEAVHMIIAAYSAVGFAVAGIHAVCLLRDRKNIFHRRAFAIALCLGGTMSLFQGVSGDDIARMVARFEPLKLAAFEALFETRSCAPLLIGGLPNLNEHTNAFGIEVPCALSLLAFHDPSATVKGLLEFPRDQWPNVTVVHIAFQIMVGAGSAMALVALWGLFLYMRSKRLPDSTWFLTAVALCGPLGLIAIESGWIVTEVGRQPWIIRDVMRTKDAVTPMPGLVVPFVFFFFLYIFLAAIVGWLLYRQVALSPVSLDPGAVLQPEVGSDDS